MTGEETTRTSATLCPVHPHPRPLTLLYIPISETSHARKPSRVLASPHMLLTPSRISIQGDVTVNRHGDTSLEDLCLRLVDAVQEFRMYARGLGPHANPGIIAGVVAADHYKLTFYAAQERVADRAEQLIVFAPDEILKAAYIVAAECGKVDSVNQDTPELNVALRRFLLVIRRNVANRLTGAVD